MQALDFLEVRLSVFYIRPPSLMRIAGVALVIVFGSYPGLSASMAVALMPPLTFSMTPSMDLIHW